MRPGVSEPNSKVLPDGSYVVIEGGGKNFGIVYHVEMKYIPFLGVHKTPLG